MYYLTDVHPDLANMVYAELDDDEVIKWGGQPNPYRMIWKTIPIFLFAIPWTAFAIFWTVMAFIMTRSEGQMWSIVFPLFGLPFILVGLGLLSSPFWEIRKAKKTVYVVTNKRAIIFEGGRQTMIHTFKPEQLNHIIRQQKQDGSGDLIFDEEVSSYGRRGHRHYKKIGFLGIPHVRDVERLLQELQL